MNPTEQIFNKLNKIIELNELPFTITNFHDLLKKIIEEIEIELSNKRKYKKVNSEFVPLKDYIANIFDNFKNIDFEKVPSELITVQTKEYIPFENKFPLFYLFSTILIFIHDTLTEINYEEYRLPIKNIFFRLTMRDIITNSKLTENIYLEITPIQHTTLSLLYLFNENNDY
jgi:hypothetical protein